MCTCFLWDSQSLIRPEDLDFRNVVVNSMTLEKWLPSDFPEVMSPSPSPSSSSYLHNGTASFVQNFIFFKHTIAKELFMCVTRNELPFPRDVVQAVLRVECETGASLRALVRDLGDILTGACELLPWYIT